MQAEQQSERDLFEAWNGGLYRGRQYEIAYAAWNARAAFSHPSPQWLPIESAPKNGTRVILAWGGKVINGFYLDNSKSSHPWEGWRVESMIVAPPGKPELWQPLPQHPSRATEAKNG